MGGGRTASGCRQSVTLPNNNRQPGIVQVRVPDLPPADLPLTGQELVWLTQLGRSKKAFIYNIAAFSISWQFITLDTTASVGNRYAANTSGGAFNLSLPGGPVTGDAIEVGDPDGTWQTNNLTVRRNGATIEGLAQDMVMDLSRARIVFAYDGATWRVFGE